MYEIVSTRTVMAEDGQHVHIELVGYTSSHIPGEPIFVDPARIQQRLAFGEQFSVNDVAVKAGKCSECGFEPYLDPQDELLALPRI